MATTDNMKLVLATVSETLGPEWATLINAAFEAVDLHDHSSDKGVKITPSGININASLDFNNNKAENVNAAALRSLSSADTSTLRSLQVVGSNLYYINGAGNAVQVTSGTSVNAPGSGALSVDTPGAYPYTVTTGDSETVLLIDTGSARTINLPAATNAMTVVLKDSTGTAETNNITVTPNGSDTIDTVNGNYTINSNFASIWLISDGVSAWYVL